MLKRLKSLMVSTLMTAIFPTFRITGNEDPGGLSPGTSAAPDQRIKELEGLLAGTTAELGRAKEKIAGMEKAAGEAADRISELDSSLKKSLIGYKAMILHSNPEILAELIAGDTLEDLDGSLVKAKELTEKIKANLKSQTSNLKVPAGAPVRGREDLSGLTSAEKIRRGLTNK